MALEFEQHPYEPTLFEKSLKTTTRYMLLQYTKPSVKRALFYLGNSMKNISQSPINLP